MKFQVRALAGMGRRSEESRWIAKKLSPQPLLSDSTQIVVSHCRTTTYSGFQFQRRNRNQFPLSGKQFFGLANG